MGEGPGGGRGRRACSAKEGQASRERRMRHSNRLGYYQPKDWEEKVVLGMSLCSLVVSWLFCIR